MHSLLGFLRNLFWFLFPWILLVVGSAPYRYPHYHEREDTPGKRCFDCLTRVTQGLIHLVRALSD